MALVSVIMPCYNHGQFLVDSVEGVLRQTHRDLELIIVDDCSLDNSWEVIGRLEGGDPRIQAIRHERNQGASKSRNDGLRVAKGDFIGFCDADDVWEEGKLAFQVELLHDHPGYDAVYCDTLIIDKGGLPTGKRFSEGVRLPNNPSGWLFQELLGRNFINIQSVLMRKECVQRTGHFDERIKWVEDWWYWVRLSQRHRFLYSQEPLARYRVHDRSTSLVQRRSYCVNRFKVFKRILKEYGSLSHSAKADIIFKMGVDLCALGKLGVGRRLLWQSFRWSITDLRAFPTFCRALRRIILHAPTPRP